MSNVTRILCAIEQGDAHAAEQLLPLVYDELCRLAVQKMAHESPGQTLQATTLVKLRFFAGLTIEQAAQALGISTSTADNDWAYARCWLRVEMEGSGQ